MRTRGAASVVRVRKGRVQDRDQIKEFTQDTFSWGDYLPGAWESWVKSRRGVLLVAETDAQIVGTCHLRLLENREGWLEGLRVRHENRKQGIASSLIQAVHAHARKNNCRIVRLETAHHNVSAQRAFEKFGYRYVVPYRGFEAKARDGELPGLRLAKPSDLSACWTLWQSSWLKRATKTIVPAPYGWRWWELTRVRLGDVIRNGRAWVAPNAFALLRVEDDAFDVTLLVGTKRDALKLLDAARVLAFRNQKKNAYWVAPHVARTAQWATEAGYVLDEDGLLIYACAL